MSYMDFINAPETHVLCTRLYGIDVPNHLWLVDHPPGEIYRDVFVSTTPFTVHVVMQGGKPLIRAYRDQPDDYETEILIRVLSELAGIRIPLAVATTHGIAFKLGSDAERTIRPTMAEVTF